MIHPLLRLAATEPHLLGDHVEAYAALVGEEVEQGLDLADHAHRALRRGARAWSPSAWSWSASRCCFCAAVPSTDYPAPWALVVVPLAPFVIAAGCVVFARSKPIEKPFDTIKKQLNADMAMLREVSAS